MAYAPIPAPRPASRMPAAPGNPLLDFFGSARGGNALIGLGSGLLSRKNFSEGLAAGGQAFTQGMQVDNEEAAARKKVADAAAERNQTLEYLKRARPDLAEKVAAGMPVSEAWNALMTPAKGSEYNERFTAGQQFGLEGEGLNTFALTGSVPGTSRTNVTYGTTPVWGRDSATQKEGYGVTGSDGSFKLVDTGTFQPMGPGDVAADRASGTLTGKTETQGAIDLPGAVAKGEYAVNQLKGLLSSVPDASGQMVPNQGFDEQFGTLGPIPIGQMTGAIPNTPKAGFQARLNQVQGQAFLQAFESLKGGGAISEVEGLKAQQAIIRASTSQTREDFEAAIKEAIGIYEMGIQRAKDLVTQGVGGRAQQTLGGSSLKTKYGLE